jgi:hypothetical protein
MPRNKALGTRGRPYAERKVNVRETIPRFLIVCEGERTEPNYFERFRVPRDVVAVEVRGIGYNTVSLVREAIKLKAEDDYDQVWCVFDRDSFPARTFNEAIRLAERNGIKVAYSNEAFELWYLLHFDFLNTGISRADYIARLTEKIGKKYEKNSRDMYDILEARQQTAIENAKRLLSIYSPCRPAKDNPSTTVHLLVIELLKFSR